VSVSEEDKRRTNYSMPSYWLVPGGTHIGIKTGEELSIRDLLHGMMLASGNDASNVIAQYIGGTIPDFMESLNEYLRGIGCQDTHFTNPHGLHHPDHKTTAYDLAVITREALKNETFREIVKATRYTRPKTNKQDPTTLVQGNRLLRRGKYYYPHTIGVKTGYTSMADNTFVAAAEKDGRKLITVLLKTPEREDMFFDAVKLFEAAFKEKKITATLLSKGPQKLVCAIPGTSRSVQAFIADDVTLSYYPSEKPSLRSVVYWDNLSLPIERGQHIGTLEVQEDSEKHTVPLYAYEEVRGSFSQRLWGSRSMKVLLGSTGLILGFLYIRRKRWL